jgi:hypothetical protein
MMMPRFARQVLLAQPYQGPVRFDQPQSDFTPFPQCTHGALQFMPRICHCPASRQSFCF